MNNKKILGNIAQAVDNPLNYKFDKIKNKNTKLSYNIRITVPEFTSICPVTSQPDFALIVIDYIPTAKCEITAALSAEGLVLIPAGDPLLDAALARSWRGRVRRVALVGDTNDSCQTADDLGDYNPATGQIQLGDHTYHCPLEGRHNARNFMLALAVANTLGVSPADLKQLMQD